MEHRMRVHGCNMCGVANNHKRARSERRREGKGIDTHPTCGIRSIFSAVVVPSMIVYVCNSIGANVSALSDPSCPVVSFNHYSTVALVPPMSTTDVWRGIT